MNEAKILDQLTDLAELNRINGIVPTGQESQFLIATVLLEIRDELEKIREKIQITADADFTTDTNESFSNGILSAKQGDTDNHIVRALGNGNKLCRCINGGGVPYSYVVNYKGQEIASLPTSEEHRLITRFDVMKGGDR